ncbi:MAG: hypothetical protein U1E60_29565 [Reyranellaceae bacterium]
MASRTEHARFARRVGLPALLLVALGACASVPMLSPQEDQEAKRFDQPAPDKGALYVYRTGWMASARAIDVAIVGGATAELATNTYLRLEGPPGSVEIDCKIGDKTDAGQVQITDGQTRYVEVSVKIGLWTPGCQVTEVSPDQGQAAVLASRRVAVQ